MHNVTVHTDTGWLCNIYPDIQYDPKRWATKKDGPPLAFHYNHFFDLLVPNISFYKLIYVFISLYTIATTR